MADGIDWLGEAPGSEELREVAEGNELQLSIEPPPTTTGGGAIAEGGGIAGLATEGGERSEVMETEARREVGVPGSASATLLFDDKLMLLCADS